MIIYKYLFNYFFYNILYMYLLIGIVILIVTLLIVLPITFIPVKAETCTAQKFEILDNFDGLGKRFKIECRKFAILFNLSDKEIENLSKQVNTKGDSPIKKIQNIDKNNIKVTVKDSFVGLVVPSYDYFEIKFDDYVIYEDKFCLLKNNCKISNIKFIKKI